MLYECTKLYIFQEVVVLYVEIAPTHLYTYPLCMKPTYNRVNHDGSTV